MSAPPGVLTDRAVAASTTCGHPWSTPIHAEGERLCWPCADAWLDRKFASCQPEDGWPIECISVNGPIVANHQHTTWKSKRWAEKQRADAEATPVGVS